MYGITFSLGCDNFGEGLHDIVVSDKLINQYSITRATETYYQILRDKIFVRENVSGWLFWI